LYPGIKFELDVRVHTDGVVRVRMDEKEGLRKRYDGAASWALLKEPTPSPSLKWDVGKSQGKVAYGDKDRVEVTVEFEPLVLRMRRNGKDQVVLNGRGLLRMEHFRRREAGPTEAEDGAVPVAEDEDRQTVTPLPPNAWFDGDTEDGFWEEQWNSWIDTKPKGVFNYSAYRISQLTSVQVQSLFPSISTSPITGMSTGSHNTPPAWIFRPLKAKGRSSRTHTVSTITTSRVTPLLRPRRYTDRSP
jgi:hypothetical protein